MQQPSLDPRVNRVVLPEAEAFEAQTTLDQWQTYEVFQQKNRGEHHTHVGSVHAPTPEMALLFAKEQYARRSKCTNMWIVKTRDVFASAYDDEEMFEHATDKSYREAYGYKNRELIDEYRKKQEPNPARAAQPTAASGSKPVIIVGKKK